LCVLTSAGEVVLDHRRLQNRIHACLAAENCRAPTTDLFGWGGRAWLTAGPLPPEVRRDIQVQLALITTLDEQLRGYDAEVKRQASRAPAARLLESIPGIGPFGTLLLLAEIGSVSRLASSHGLAAYAGLVPSTRSSGDETAHGSVARAGSGWLKWILIEAGQAHKQVPGPVPWHYERLLRAKGKPKATEAAARKL
jgi:transposase